MSEMLVLAGIAVTAFSGVPGLLFGRHARGGQWLTTVLAVLGTGLGLGGAGAYWVTGDSRPIVFQWTLPGEFDVAVDGLSAVFLLPIFLISLLGSLYGLGYWPQIEHAANGRKLRLFYGLITAGMALLVISRNGILFLLGWEIMALSAYFLVTAEDHEQEVRETGWLYLVATHVATLSLFGLFGLLRGAAGSFSLVPLDPESLTPEAATAIFVLALVGFGIKAGLMPLHIWLPSAHAIAPSHVSAIMSGVIIKMGIYGLVRITSLLPSPPLEWGGTVLTLGAISGVLGVAFAIGQHDLKRLLAYHSIENIGIIVMGLGLALAGRSLGRTDWMILGLGSALLHVWNHAFFKALLFLCAGSVIHAVKTREIDRLGGLAKTMPWTALSFLVGAAAICGLPPLNGFVSEFLLYLGLFATLKGRHDPSFVTAALAAPALALIGGLALACFVKAYGAVFLGSARYPRTSVTESSSEKGSDPLPYPVFSVLSGEDTRGWARGQTPFRTDSEMASGGIGEAHESPVSMLGPMAVLVACCFLIGLAPILIAPLIGEGVNAWAPELKGSGSQLAQLAHLDWITAVGLLLIGALAAGGAVLWLRLRHGAVEKGPTWGCGYAAPTPRMQYTSSSFAQMLTSLFGWALRPRCRRPSGLPNFPARSSFHSEVPDVVLDEAVLPSFRFLAWLFAWGRVLHQGSIQTYLLYIFLALIALLLWR